MPHKGKVPTKGAKQILDENAATLNFYRSMAMGSTFIHWLGIMLGIGNCLSKQTLVTNLFVTFVYGACYSFMKYLSRPRYSHETQVIVDPGLDLNMEGGIGEHLKDLIIFTATTHTLATFSKHFWLLLLLMPGGMCYVLCKHLLGPAFFQEVPEDTEQEEKKRRKVEKKLFHSK